MAALYPRFRGDRHPTRVLRGEKARHPTAIRVSRLRYTSAWGSLGRRAHRPPGLSVEIVPHSCAPCPWGRAEEPEARGLRTPSRLLAHSLACRRETLP